MAEPSRYKLCLLCNDKIQIQQCENVFCLKFKIAKWIAQFENLNTYIIYAVKFGIWVHSGAEDGAGM